MMKNPEDSNDFWRQFNAEVERLRASISSPPDISSPSMAPHFVQLKEQSSALQTYATSSVRVLPAYDIRRSQENIEAVNSEIRASEATLLPKKKFSFANRNKTKPVVPPAVAATPKSKDSSADATTAASAVASLSLLGSYTVLQQVDQRIVITASDIEERLQQQQNKISQLPTPAGGVSVPPTTPSEPLSLSSTFSHKDTQLFIKQCSKSYIAVEALVGSVRCEDLTACEVTLGPCCTSVYLESVVDCTLRIACHQLRIHTSSKCKLYVRVAGHPIIEDCSNMGFAPYANPCHSYSGIERDFQEADLASAACWNNVVDFRWHKSTQSPNWYLLPSAEPTTTAASKTSVNTTVEVDVNAARTREGEDDDEEEI